MKIEDTSVYYPWLGWALKKKRSSCAWKKKCHCSRTCACTTHSLETTTISTKKTDLFATQDKTNKQAGVVERMITNGEKGGEVGYLGPFLDPGSWHFNGMIERPQQPIPGTHGWALGVIAQTVSRNQHLQVV